MSETEKLIDKIKVLENVSNDKDVAKILGVKPDTLSQWKKRNKIPYAELIKYCSLQNVNLDSIFKNNQKMTSNGNIVNNSNMIGNINNSNIVIKNNSQYPKEVTNLEDEMLECYRTLDKEKQEYYYYKIKADALEKKFNN